MLLEIDKEVELKIIDLALTHIKKVELNPELQTDGDNFDYWNSFELDDGVFVDYNIHESNFGTEYDDFDGYEWHCSVYAVDPPEESGGYHQINTNVEKYLFYYKDGKIEYGD